jgi:hypothetical protein
MLELLAKDEYSIKKEQDENGYSSVNTLPFKFNNQAFVY